MLRFLANVLEDIDDDIKDRSKAIICAILLCYFIYILLLIWEAITPLKEITFRSGLKNAFYIHKAPINTNEPEIKNKPESLSEPIEGQDPPPIHVEEVNPDILRRATIKQEVNEEYVDEFCRTKGFTKWIKTHYQRNMFFFYVACGFAFLAQSQTSCVVALWLVLAGKAIQVIGLYFGLAIICYLCHALVIGLNLFVMIVSANKVASTIP